MVHPRIGKGGPPAHRLIFKAIAISLILNCGLALSAFLYNAQRPSVLSRVADALAAPPGVIANWIFAPKQHSYPALVTAMLGALLCSIVFYTAVTWGVLKLIAYLRSVTQDRVEEGPP
jgi:hypothetical protein